MRQKQTLSMSSSSAMGNPYHQAEMQRHIAHKSESVHISQTQLHGHLISPPEQTQASQTKGADTCIAN